MIILQKPSMVATAMIISSCFEDLHLDTCMSVGFDRTDFNLNNKVVIDLINYGGFREFRPLVLGDVIIYRKNE